MNHKRNQTLALASAALLSFAVLSPAAYADSSKGTGETDAYKVTLQALQGKDHTDLYIQAEGQNGHAAPSALKKVQLKSYKNDKLAYTRNFNQEIPSPNGAADIELTDVLRHQPLKTQVTIQNDESKSANVLDATAVVMMRPDLVIDKIDAPEQVQVHAPFEVRAGLGEINRDLGANVTVTIKNGDQVLDTAEGVVVDAGGTKAVSFMITLPETGTYNLTASIDSSEPAEYDTTNNTKSFTVKSIIPTRTMYVSAGYEASHTSGKYDYYFINQLEESGTFTSEYEWFSMAVITPEQINFAGTIDFNASSEKGTEATEHLSGFALKSSGTSKSYYGNSLSIYQDQNGTQVRYTRDTNNTHRSTNWSRYGNYRTDDSGYGTVFPGHPQQFIKGFFDIPDTNGVHWGGEATLNLYSNVETYDYHYQPSWHDDTHYYGTSTRASGWIWYYPGYENATETTWPEQ